MKKQVFSTIAEFAEHNKSKGADLGGKKDLGKRSEQPKVQIPEEGKVPPKVEIPEEGKVPPFEKDPYFNSALNENTEEPTLLSTIPVELHGVVYQTLIDFGIDPLTPISSVMDIAVSVAIEKLAAFGEEYFRDLYDKSIDKFYQALEEKNGSKALVMDIFSNLVLVLAEWAATADEQQNKPDYYLEYCLKSRSNQAILKRRAKEREQAKEPATGKKPVAKAKTKGRK